MIVNEIWAQLCGQVRRMGPIKVLATWVHDKRHSKCQCSSQMVEQKEWSRLGYLRVWVHNTCAPSYGLQVRTQSYGFEECGEWLNMVGYGQD